MASSWSTRPNPVYIWHYDPLSLKLVYLQTFLKNRSWIWILSGMLHLCICKCHVTSITLSSSLETVIYCCQIYQISTHLMCSLVCVISHTWQYKGASIKTAVVPIFVILCVIHYVCFFVSELTVNDAWINYSNTCTK